MNEQFEKYAAPLKDIQALYVKNVEAFVDMQLKLGEENAKAGVEQLKNAAEVKDAETLKTFLDSQAAVTQQFNERVVENTRAAVEMGNAYTAELQEILKGAFTAK